MRPDELTGVLEFLRAAEQLKNVHRSAWTSGGERESVAEHTWRLCLMALVLGDELGGVDLGRLLRICVVHDLGEAIGGDVPAVAQDPDAPKAGQERRDLLTLIAPLPERMRDEIVTLWDEYEDAASPEARMAKALDKLETILQHNQGRNPADFDYRFNLTYGARYTRNHPLIAELRGLLDAETAGHATRQEAGLNRERAGRVEGIWLKRAKGGPMDPVAAAELVAERGLVGNANQGGRRQVTIIARETWHELMSELDASIAPSARRANLMVSGLDLEQTRGGTLQVGGALLEIAGETRPCEQMDAALPGLRRAMQERWRGGVFAKVLRGGEIRIGDPVILQLADAEA